MTESSLAQSLWSARINGHAIPRPDIALDMVSAYDIQREIISLSGLQQIGWKVGSTSEAAQQKLGTSEPGACALLNDFNFASGETVPISPSHHVFVEGEFAFVVGQDLVFDDEPSIDAISECIDAILPGLEVVGSRYESGLDGSGRELVTADCGANIAFVGGTQQPRWSGDSLAQHPVQLYLNDERVASGHGRDALGHPLNVMRWLIGHAAKQGVVVEQGQIVTTGTCTGLVAVAPGDSVRVDFGEIGEVRAVFSELVTR